MVKLDEDLNNLVIVNFGVASYELSSNTKINRFHVNTISNGYAVIGMWEWIMFILKYEEMQISILFMN